MTTGTTRFGVFPSLMDPARRAADRLLDEVGAGIKVSIPELGMYVALKDKAVGGEIVSEFDHRGRLFVLCQES